MTALERLERSQAEAVVAGLTDYRAGDIVRHKEGQYAMVIDPNMTRCGWIYASWLSCAHRSRNEHRRGLICGQCDPAFIAKQVLAVFNVAGLPPAILKWCSVPTYLKAANVRLWNRS